MRSLVAALALCSSLAHAGTFNVDLTSPSLLLQDLDPSDGVAPTLSITTGSLAAWNTPLHFGGEFWADYDGMVPPPSLTLTGVLGAHSGLSWAGVLEFTGSMIYTPPDAEHVFIMGGVGGYAENGTVVSIETPPDIYSGDVHRVDPMSLLVRNDQDEANNFTLNMSFTVTPYSPFVRPVPEPSTYLMMLGGLALLPLARRRLKGGRA